MCGLFGCITSTKNSKLTSNQRLLKKRILSGLAISMEERGVHSTGIAAITHSASEIHKDILEAGKFIGTVEYNKILNANPKIVIGHTRNKTVGAVVKKNAHPFQDGTIIGAHNGSVSNWLKVFYKGDVDSQAIFHLLNKENNDFKKAFAELSGTMAITWIDEGNRSVVHLVRHLKPLHITFVSEIQTYFWCSLPLPLSAVITAATGEVPPVIAELPEDVVYTIDGNLTTTRTPVEFLKYTAPNYQTGYGHADQSWWERQTTPALPKPAVRKKKIKKFWNIRKGKVIEFDRDGVAALFDGCDQCGKQIANTLPFFYHPQRRVCVHAGCLQDYCVSVKDIYGMKTPHLVSYNSSKHARILEENSALFESSKSKKETTEATGFMSFSQALTLLH